MNLNSRLVELYKDAAKEKMAAQVRFSQEFQRAKAGKVTDEHAKQIAIEVTGAELTDCEAKMVAVEMILNDAVLSGEYNDTKSDPNATDEGGTSLESAEQDGDSADSADRVQPVPTGSPPGKVSR